MPKLLFWILAPFVWIFWEIIHRSEGRRYGPFGFRGKARDRFVN